MGSLGSLAGGIYHENQTNNNPKGEWNMDSWNNEKGRQIAKEIKKEYGEKEFRKLPQEKQEDIIAQKVMFKLENGELITSPDDKRLFLGIPEHTLNITKNVKEKCEEGINEIKDVFTNRASSVLEPKNKFSGKNMPHSIKPKGVQTGPAAPITRKEDKKILSEELIIENISDKDETIKPVEEQTPKNITPIKQISQEEWDKHFTIDKKLIGISFEEVNFIAKTFMFAVMQGKINRPI